jgi:hypothetical protein
MCTSTCDDDLKLDKWKDASLQKWMKWASTEAGLHGWPRLFQLGHETDVQRREDENEMIELMKQLSEISWFQIRLW